MKKFYQSQVYVDSGIIPSEFAQFLPSYQRDIEDEAWSNDAEVLQYICYLLLYNLSVHTLYALDKI